MYLNNRISRLSAALQQPNQPCQTDSADDDSRINIYIETEIRSGFNGAESTLYLEPSRSRNELNVLREVVFAAQQVEVSSEILDNNLDN